MKIRFAENQFGRSNFRFLALSLVFILIAASFTWMPKVFAQNALAKTEEGGISQEEFVSSPAANFFQQENYEEAVDAFDVLLQKYPKDPLIRRYKAMALDQMGKSKEAAAIFEDLLLDYPDHLPTHYFLGQAYARNGEMEKARKEWEWVAAHGSGTPYQEWSQGSLRRFAEGKPASATPKIQRWNITARYGYEYDSNVIVKPDDRSVAEDRDASAGRQIGDLALRYRAFSRRDLALDLLYAVRQSFHDSSLNEFNFHSEEFGFNLRKELNINDRVWVAGLRYEFLLGILEDDFYAARNRWHISAETRFTPRTRTVFYDRYTLSQYDEDGSEPSLTSRDGGYNDVGVTHFLYTSDFKRYVYFRQELNSAQTRGDNFKSIGATSRVGFSTPVINRLNLETSTGVVFGFYPYFSSVSSFDTSRRRDVEWDIYTALTYRFTPQFAVRGFYRFIDAWNQNNLFDYTRHIGGAQVIYDWGF